MTLCLLSSENGEACLTPLLFEIFSVKRCSLVPLTAAKPIFFALTPFTKLKSEVKSMGIGRRFSQNVLYSS